MAWHKADPSWKDIPPVVDEPSGLVKAESGPIRIVGWLGEFLEKYKKAGFDPVDVDFWLGADLAQKDQPLAIARGKITVNDRDLVFSMDWDINSFKLLNSVLKDRSLLDPDTHIGEINYYFGGKPVDLPRPRN